MTPTEIEARFDEAARTLRRLPDVPKPQGYFNTWPTVIRTAWEVAAMEREPLRVLATPASISRMEECFGWMLWLAADDAKIVWMRAEGMSFRAISRRMGMSRSTAWRHWVAALILIANRIEKERRKSLPKRDAEMRRATDIAPKLRSIRQ